MTKPTGCPVPRVSDCCGEPIVNGAYCSKCKWSCVACPDISGLLEEIEKEPATMPDPIRIPLDGPVPTEPGTYIGELNHPLYTKVAMYRLTESDLEHLKEAYPNARWSRRIEIGG